MASAPCPICEVLVEVDRSGACPRCGSALTAPDRMEISDGFRAPSRPEGAGRREVTSQKLDLRDSGLDFADPPAASPDPDRTSRPDWAKPRRTRESAAVVAGTSPATWPPQAIVWGAGALLAIAAGFALSYLVG